MSSILSALLAQATGTDWTAVWTVVGIGIALLCTLFGMMFQAGRQSQKMDNLIERFDKFEKRSEIMGDSVISLGRDMVALQTKAGMKTEAEQ